MSFHSYANNQNNTNNNANSINPTQVGPALNTAQLAQNNIPSELIDYNKRFKTAVPVAFRDSIISEVYAIMLQAKKPNALLIGPAGVGKTAIVQEIARQLANNDPRIPDTLKKMNIYELPLSGLVAGSSLVGQIEQRLQNIIDFAVKPGNHAILFIDEIHQLESRDSTYSQIAQILKPAMARGNLHIIGATTTQESRDLMRDPAFNRRFSNITVDELTKDQELVILQNELPALLTHYNNQVDIKTSLLSSIIDISDDILRPKTHRPDSGLTLLDRALGESIVNKKEQLIKMKNNPAVLQVLQADPKAHVNLNSLNKIAQKIVTGSSVKPSVTKDDLTHALSPVIGQDEAIHTIINALLINQLGLFNNDKPFSFLLMGPSGVGKTMVSNIVSDLYTKTKPITLNLTEYNTSASINRIIGSPAGYVGSDSHQELPFDSLESNPYQVILLDEFEKADPAVQRLFMRVLDEGKLQLANNHMIDFSKTIIFATTNASHTRTSMATIGFEGGNNKPSDKLKNDFDTELLNRFSRIVEFNTISKDKFKEIMQNQYAELFPKIHRIIINAQAKLTNDELASLADKYYDASFGARPVKAALENYVQSLL